MLEKIFKLSENKNRCKNRGSCRNYNIYDNGVYPGSESKYPVGGRNGFRCSIYCNSIGCIRRNIADGSTCKLSVCISTWEWG